jgi:hypothetical protein
MQCALLLLVKGGSEGSYVQIVLPRNKVPKREVGGGGGLRGLSK